MGGKVQWTLNLLAVAFYYKRGSKYSERSIYRVGTMRCRDLKVETPLWGKRATNIVSEYNIGAYYFCATLSYHVRGLSEYCVF